MTPYVSSPPQKRCLLPIHSTKRTAEGQRQRRGCCGCPGSHVVHRALQNQSTSTGKLSTEKKFTACRRNASLLWSTSAAKMSSDTDDAAKFWSNGSSELYGGLLLEANSTNLTSGNESEPNSLDLTRAVPLGMVLGAFIVFAIVGNILVILSVVCNRHLRTPTNYFIINLAIADLLLSTTVLPVSATLEILNYWVFGRIFCDIWAAVDVLCCTASIMSLCVISIDRYIGVSYPLRYPSIVTERRALLAMFGVWVLSVVISIGPLLGWKQAPSPDDRVCRINEEPFYALFSSLGSFYIPLVVILSMYCRVYIVAKKTTKNLEAGVMKERTDSSELTLRIHKGSQIHEDSGSTGKGRGQPSRSSLTVKLLKFSREKKAAKTLGVVVGMFTLCWLPFFIALPIASPAW
ncbi:alpha-1B adrenergic receptor-like isoform X3 [Brienomyrus brachyistius]|uniref:alpha-1B adrenergic receptor-like isoform X3 n=1 Tax=Brienomyrus brachyistius TaxID=42636 RepID=UPI0020B1C073|nr:alpha-1B adrenergic receptor-like isoform X3 [Brienomyrus brachyistius]